MDVLRSCYSTRMRFDPAAPGTSSRVDWYFCPPAAKVFPSAHSFGSLNWYRGSGLPDAPLGELQAAPRPWRNGSRPSEAAGLKVCEGVDKFLTGEPYLVTPRAEYPDGFPRCCNAVDTGVFLDAGAAASGYLCQGNPIPTFQIIVKVVAPTGAPWAPYVGQSYSLLYQPQSFPPLYVNNAAGGGMGIKMHIVCSGLGQGWFLRAGGGSSGDTGPQYPVLSVGEHFVQNFPSFFSVATFQIVAF